MHLDLPCPAGTWPFPQGAGSQEFIALWISAGNFNMHSAGRMGSAFLPVSVQPRGVNIYSCASGVHTPSRSTLTSSARGVNRERLLHMETRGSQNGASAVGAARRVRIRGRVGAQASPCPGSLCTLRALKIGLTAMPGLVLLIPSPNKVSPEAFMFSFSFIRSFIVAPWKMQPECGSLVESGGRRAGSWQQGCGTEWGSSGLGLGTVWPGGQTP